MLPTACTLQTADYASQADTLHAIRHAVFVLGQGIDPALERDDDDAAALHVIARDAQGQPVGTGRLVHDGRNGRIGRMAVLPALRGQGVGQAMLAWLHTQARQSGLGQLTVHAQLPALSLYLRAGYLPTGAVFEEAGLAHRPLQLRLDGTMAVADELGAQAALACVIHGTGRQLCLAAPLLDPGLLDAPLVLDALRGLASRRQPLQVQILVDDPTAIVRRGGPLLALLQRLPGRFALRQRDLERTDKADAVAVNDRGHAFHRADASVPAGVAGLPWRPFAATCLTRFQVQWSASLECAELRPIRL